MSGETSFWIEWGGQAQDLRSDRVRPKYKKAYLMQKKNGPFQKEGEMYGRSRVHSRHFLLEGVVVTGRKLLSPGMGEKGKEAAVRRCGEITISSNRLEDTRGGGGGIAFGYS